MKNNLNAKSINYEYLDNYYYYRIINDILDDDYIDQFIQNEEYKSLKDFKDIDETFTELEYKINFPTSKKLKYIINFEIVDKDIKNFFIENNIAKEEHFISLDFYKCDNEKILIAFNKNNNNFYEIGNFNDNEDFIIEYLIDELENSNKYSIIDYFFNNKIDLFIKYDSKELQNIINLDSLKKKKCYYYNIEEKSNSKEKKSYLTRFGNSITIRSNNFDIIDNKFVNSLF